MYHYHDTFAIYIEKCHGIFLQYIFLPLKDYLFTLIHFHGSLMYHCIVSLYLLLQNIPMVYIYTMVFSMYHGTFSQNTNVSLYILMHFSTFSIHLIPIVHFHITIVHFYSILMYLSKLNYIMVHSYFLLQIFNILSIIMIHFHCTLIYHGTFSIYYETFPQ